MFTIHISSVLRNRCPFAPRLQFSSLSRARFRVSGAEGEHRRVSSRIMEALNYQLIERPSISRRRTDRGVRSSGCGPISGLFCSFTNGVSSVGRQEDEEWLTPEQRHVSGEHGRRFCDYSEGGTVAVSPLRRRVLARPFGCSCTTSSHFSDNYCSLVFFFSASTQRRTGFLLELCMFVCWFHYRSRCLSALE